MSSVGVVSEVAKWPLGSRGTELGGVGKMSAQVGGFGAQGRADPNRIQATLVGLVDSKEMHNNLIQALRAWSGNKEQKLLHRESVFKLPQAAGGTARPDQQGVPPVRS